MTGIVMPQDRTIKQPAFAFCSNRQCREGGREFRFRIEHDHCVCPKCGADRPPMVGPLVLTHWIAPDPSGPITGRGGRRFKLACETDRAYLATASNLEAATDQVQLVTCRGCYRAALAAGGDIRKAAERNVQSRLITEG